MAVPSSGPISLTDIQNEFGGTTPIPLSEYYKGGAYVAVTDFAPNVPYSGQISLSDFYGAAKTTLFTYTYTSDTAVTLPATFRSPLTISALGGGGGAGGNDAQYSGYPGYAGAIVTGSIAAAPGDTVNIYIGGGGGGGGDGGLYPGGGGGSCGAGYTGGAGGASGGSGSSGSGGGGGGATVIQINSSSQVVAAGGGGGGGAGHAFSQDGKPNNSNPGTAGTLYGSNGQPKSGDGGGGGGGGGGYNGGIGGTTYGGDSGAYSGENGNCLVPAGGSISIGANGGPSSSQPGTGGSVTISYYA